jgi:hypothetical protein
MLTLSDVIPAIESAYLAAAHQRARLYPVAREPLQTSGGVFGIKSRYLAGPGIAWPDGGRLLAAKRVEGRG